MPNYLQGRLLSVDSFGLTSEVNVDDLKQEVIMGRKQDDIDRITALEKEVERLTESNTDLYAAVEYLKEVAIQDIHKQLEDIVCTVEPDEGVVLLSQDGPCHDEEWDGKIVSVYDHEYFSPLGDALMKLYNETDQDYLEQQLQQLHEIGNEQPEST